MCISFVTPQVTHKMQPCVAVIIRKCELVIEVINQVQFRPNLITIVIVSYAWRRANLIIDMAGIKV